MAANGDLVPEDFPHDGLTAFRFPVQQLAADAGAPLGGSLVLLGAYCTLTGLCSTDSLVTAMRRLVPPYRTQHLIGNEAALRAGSGAATPLTAPAWGTQPVLTTSEAP